MNTTLLRSTWEEAQSHGDAFVEWFYVELFLAHPELRPLFPADMRRQRAHLVVTLAMVVRCADDPEAITPRLRRLGADHRGYGVVADHYPAVAEALLATLEHFLGDAWTDDAAKTWAYALDLVATIMIDAAREASDAHVPFGWLATVYTVERGDETVSLAVAVTDWPVSGGEIVPVSIPDQPSTRREARVAGWTAERALTVIEVAVDAIGDPITLTFAHLEAGDQIHLGAPLDPVDEGGQ